MPRVLVVLLATAFSTFAAPCTVAEEMRGPLYLALTARFSVQPMTATVTVPRQLFLHEVVTMFLEVAGGNSSNSPRLFLETDGDRVAIADGASLHLDPRLHERVIFNLLTESGESLCTWLPAVRIIAKSPPHVEDGFRGVPASIIFNAGEPLHLAIGGKLANGSGKFRIDGKNAMVLTRTSWEVILRDPQPAPGFRTVESPNHSITLPFVQVALQLSKSVLDIKVVGFDSVRRNPAYLPRLSLTNLNERAISVLCGKSVVHSHDEYNGRVIPLRPRGDGAYVATCKVKYLKEGPVDLFARVFEIPPHVSQPRLHLPRQPILAKGVLE